MTNGAEHRITRQDLDALKSEIIALERHWIQEHHELAKRVLRLELYHETELPRLQEIEKDRKRLGLAGWGVAFAVGGTLLNVARQILMG